MFSTEVEEEEAKCEHLKRVFIGDDKEKFFQVEVQLPPWERQELIDFVRKNINVFTWSAYKALRVDLDFNCHRLNVNPFAILKKQQPRRSSKEHFDAVKGEVSSSSRLGP